MAVLFDHIVVSARARLEGGAHVTRLTGVEMGMGGEHDMIEEHRHHTHTHTHTHTHKQP